MAYQAFNAPTPSVAQPRWNPVTQQVRISVKVKPTANLPNKRSQVHKSYADIAMHANGNVEEEDKEMQALLDPYFPGGKTVGASASSGVYDLSLGEFFFIDPKRNRANPNPNYAGITVEGFTSLNNITNTELDDAEVYGVCTQPFSFAQDGTGSTGQLSCDLAGTCTVINNGEKTIPAGSRVMLTFPSKDHHARTIAGNHPDKRLPITSPVTSSTLSSILDTLWAIDDEAGADDVAAKEKFLSGRGLDFPKHTRMYEHVTRPLTTVLSGNGAHDRKTIIQNMLKVQNYIRKFTVGVALECSPPGQKLDLLLCLR